MVIDTNILIAHLNNDRRTYGLELPDAVIAATAMHYRVPLVTRIKFSGRSKKLVSSGFEEEIAPRYLDVKILIFTLLKFVRD